jgi:hypothetical protein
MILLSDVNIKSRFNKGGNVMSEYQEFLAEREKIDFLTEKGFTIKGVNENLSGAFVEFTKGDSEGETLHIKTADARKYFSNLILKSTRA